MPKTTFLVLIALIVLTGALQAQTFSTEAGSKPSVQVKNITVNGQSDDYVMQIPYQEGNSFTIEAVIDVSDGEILRGNHITVEVRQIDGDAKMNFYYEDLEEDLKIDPTPFSYFASVSKLIKEPGKEITVKFKVFMRRENKATGIQTLRIGVPMIWRNVDGKNAIDILTGDPSKDAMQADHEGKIIKVNII